ncbi:hypothetical protein B484DRAFT_401072, partial [Ochromonadaceae sp. CCMP2298]
GGGGIESGAGGVEGGGDSASGYGPLSRLALGRAIRGAGEGYTAALHLGAATLVLERLQEKGMGAGSGGVGTAAVLRGIANDLVGVSAELHGGAIEEEKGDSAHTPTASTPTSAHAAYLTEMTTVLSATSLLLHAISSLHLHTASTLVPPYSGTHIQKAFPLLPRGALIGEILDVQVQWGLHHRGSDGELMAFLRKEYKQYL